MISDNMKIMIARKLLQKNSLLNSTGSLKTSATSNFKFLKRSSLLLFSFLCLFIMSCDETSGNVCTEGFDSRCEARENIDSNRPTP